MRRKVIKQASQAYTITLPIEWVRQNKINEKTELEVTPEEKSLIIRSTTGKVDGGKISLDVSEVNSRIIQITVSSLFAKGIDEIEIISNKNISERLMSACANTLGYAVVSQEKNKWIIKDVGSSNYSDIDEIFKRIFQMILAFYDSAIVDIFGEEKETEENLKLRDREVNKFCLYLQRAVNKMSYQNAIDGRTLFTYSFELEKLGDEIERLWRTNIKYDVKKTEKLKELAELVKNGLEQAFDSYFMFSLGRIGECSKIREQVREESLKYYKANPETTRFIRHLVKIIEEANDLTPLNIMRRLK
jgi:phosphate uptake regulator